MLLQRTVGQTEEPCGLGVLRKRGGKPAVLEVMFGLREFDQTAGEDRRAKTTVAKMSGEEGWGICEGYPRSGVGI